MIFHFSAKCDLCDVPSNLKTSGAFSKMVKIEKDFHQTSSNQLIF